MDATAAGGGPITMLPRIVTGQPESILSHVTDVLGKAAKFVTLLEDLDRARQQLGQVWSGKASESALQKISDSLQQFEKIIKAIQDGAKLLEEAARLVQVVQTAYRSIVSSVNPTVAALMSSHWTRPAAHALSTAASSSLRTFIESIAALMNALGVTKIGTVLTDISGIIGALEGLFGKGSDGSPLNTGSVSGTQVTAPGQVNTVASSTGQQALTGNIGTLPTMSPLTGGTTAASGLSGLLGVPGQATNGVTSGLGDFMNYTPAALGGTAGAGTGAGIAVGDTDAWLPVDHGGNADAGSATGTDTGATDTGSTGTDAGSAGGHETTITAHKGDLTVTVTTETDPGHAGGIDLDVSSGADHIVEHVDIDAAGKVSVG
ncbi:WXG100 family type VII secretion target [Actinocatenispora rupis]|nr:WXG100 family type VII secretion target [Actinocatenispora rupis]